MEEGKSYRVQVNEWNILTPQVFELCEISGGGGVKMRKDETNLLN